MGCDQARKTFLGWWPNFNPRTHVGCDSGERYVSHVHRISIHAPTWGATIGGKYTHLAILISIHAPTWGATLQQWLERNNIADFNPRTHVGCDLRILQPIRCKKISIHAPTWGATVKPSNGWLLGHKDNEFANENIIIINSVNIT